MNRSGGEVEFSGVRTDGGIALVKLNLVDEVEYFGLIRGHALSYLGNGLVNQGESGDYFGEIAPDCSGADGCTEGMAVPVLAGRGLAVLVVLLLATAVLAM